MRNKNIMIMEKKKKNRPALILNENSDCKPVLIAYIDFRFTSPSLQKFIAKFIILISGIFTHSQRHGGFNTS